MAIARIGVVGAGTMGHGIAQVAAQAGYDVVLQDAAPEALERGMAQVAKGLARLVDKGKLAAADRAGALARLRPAADLAAFAEVDLAVEAVVEKLEVKQAVLAELDRVCPPAGSGARAVLRSGSGAGLRQEVRGCADARRSPAALCGQAAAR